MSKEIILLARQITQELKATRAVKSGLRNRLNELRCKLLSWLSSETRRGPAEAKYRHGPLKRQRVIQENGSHKYQLVPTLIETGELLPGCLVRSQLYEGIEALLVAVAEGCAANPKPSGSPQACADEMVRLCEYLESQIGEPAKDSSETCINDVKTHSLIELSGRKHRSTNHRTHPFTPRLSR